MQPTGGRWASFQVLWVLSARAFSTVVPPDG
jgi:hypothetical protein